MESHLWTVIHFQAVHHVTNALSFGEEWFGGRFPDFILITVMARMVRIILPMGEGLRRIPLNLSFPVPRLILLC